MGKYRTCIEITADILYAASAGATKTRILQSTGLSTSSLTRHLYAMFANGLLDYEIAEHKFISSPKGMDFLQVYEDMAAITNVIQVLKQKQFERPVLVKYQSTELSP